jgi:hypothetical protein
MADSAVDFLAQYNSHDSFPTRASFQPHLINDPVHYAPHLRPHDRDEVGGIWYGQKSVHAEFRVVVTSPFESAEFEEFLTQTAPIHLCTISVQIQQSVIRNSSLCSTAIDASNAHPNDFGIDRA